MKLPACSNQYINRHCNSINKCGNHLHFLNTAIKETSAGNPAVYGHKFIILFLLYIHTALTACICPVDPVCHQLACHRHPFSLSCTRNHTFIALFTAIDFAISATPISQRLNVHYLHIYGTHDISRGSMRSTQIQFLCLRFTNLSPRVR